MNDSHWAGAFERSQLLGPVHIQPDRARTEIELRAR